MGGSCSRQAMVEEEVPEARQSNNNLLVTSDLKILKAI